MAVSNSSQAYSSEIRMTTYTAKQWCRPLNLSHIRNMQQSQIENKWLVFQKLNYKDLVKPMTESFHFFILLIAIFHLIFWSCLRQSLGSKHALCSADVSSFHNARIYSKWYFPPLKLVLVVSCAFEGIEFKLSHICNRNIKRSGIPNYTQYSYENR